MAGRPGVDWRAFYVPPMALFACNTRTTVTSGTGERSREPQGQEGDSTSRTIHRSQCLVGIPGSWVGWESYLAREFNHGAKLIGINFRATGGTWPYLLTKSVFGDKAVAVYNKVLKESHFSVGCFPLLLFRGTCATRKALSS